MTARMMRKLRICQVTYQVIDLSDKYELLENFLLHDGEHFDNTFKLRYTVVQVQSIKNVSMLCAKTVTIKVNSEILGSSTRFVRGKSYVNLSSVTDSDPCIANIVEIKLVGRVLSCLKHMSNYNVDEAQFGGIDNLYKVGCDNLFLQNPQLLMRLYICSHLMIWYLLI
jgi:hypothetical protein